MKRALVIVALLALSSHAGAQSEADRAAARERFEEGIKLFRRGDPDGAAAQFQRAYELSPHPVILYNLGLAFEALGRSVEAADAMQRVLAAPGSLAEERLARARETLARESALVAELEVACPIDGAAVRVNGIDRGRTPLAAPLRVKGGTVLIEVAAPGHVPTRQEVLIAGREKKRVLVEPAPSSRAMAELLVETALPGADVLVDGRRVATTPLTASLALEPGTHHVELRRAGYRTASAEVTLAEGGHGSVALDPEEDALVVQRDGGVLLLELREPQSVVAVDGKARGVDPGALRLAAGEHLLSVERGGFVPYTRRVSVRAGTTETLAIALDPTPETLADHASRASAFQIGGWVAVGLGAALTGASTALLVHTRGEKADAREAAEAFNLVAADGSGGRCDPLSPSFDQNQPSCEAEQQSINEQQDELGDRDVVGGIGVGLGVAALATGITLLLVGPDPDQYEEPESGELLARVRLTTAPASEGVWLGLGGEL